MVYAINQFAEDIHLLRKFRIFPEVVFVMIFKDEGYVPLRCIGETTVNTIGCQFYSLINGKLRSSLTGEHATE